MMEKNDDRVQESAICELERLRAEIALGDTDIEAGRITEYTSEKKLFEDITA